MGFDNECILNIQSLAGEYFCPVCRLLVYPNEALQSQCTHLYCRPCLSYVVNTTQACPYDGYLVTEADSKPLVESNKALAETIGKVNVHCLFHRSGCTWKGPLSECTAHGSGCVFGNSPVVCNRCGIQIIHRQVQEHAQSCPGVQQPQAQPAEGVQDAAATGTTATSDQTQATSQVGATTSLIQTQATATPTPGKDPSQQAHSNAQVQATGEAAVPTADQWYQQQQQQQYQQYYQQYPGYNPQQQHYQQYYPYQQQAVPQYQQHHLQAQPQGYVQPQPQPQSQVQPQPQVQPQSQPQPQLQPSHPPVQAPMAAQPQNQAQVNPPQQTHPLPHSNPIPQQQSYPQAQPLPQHIQITQNQQLHSQQSLPQIQHATSQPHPPPPPPPQMQPLPQTQLQTPAQHHHQPQLHPPQAQPQLHPPQAQPQVHPPQGQPQHIAANAVTGHHSYPQQPQQIPLVSAPLYMHAHPHGGANPPMQNQFSQQTPQMRPPQSHATIPNQQLPAMVPSTGQVPNVPPVQQPQQPLVHPHAHQPGVLVHQRPAMQPVQQSMPHQYVSQQHSIGGPYQQGPFAQAVHSQSRPQGPAHTLQHPHAYAQPQQNVALLPGMQHRQALGPAMTPNHGIQSKHYPQSTAGLQVRPAQLGANQPSLDQSNLLRTNNQMQTQLSSELHSGVTSKFAIFEKQGIAEINVDKREGESSFQKNAEKDVNNLDAMSAPHSDAGGLKIPETDVNTIADGIKAEVKDETNVIDPSKKDFVTELESAEAAVKKIAEKEVGENVKDLKDHANIDSKHVEHSLLESKAIQDGLLQKTSPLQEAAELGDKNVPQAPGASQGVGGVLPAGQVHSGVLMQSPPPLYGSSTQKQRYAAPSILQAHLPGPLHPTHAPGYPPTHFRPQGSDHVLHPPENFYPAMIKSHGPEKSPGSIPSSGSAASYGRVPSHHSLPLHSFESQSVAHQGPYSHVHLPPSHVPTPKISQGDPVRGPPLRPLVPGAFDSHSGLMADGPPSGPEGRMAQRQQVDPVEAETLSNERLGYMDGRRPDSHLPGSLERGPLGHPSVIHSNMMRMNGAPGLEFRNERFKPFPDEHLNPFPMDPARRVSDRGEFKDHLQQFPRLSHLDAEPVPKLGSHFSSSRSLDGGPHAFHMDVRPRSFDRGLNYDSIAGSAPSRYLPYAGDRPFGIHDDAAGRSDPAYTHPDFIGPGTGYGRHHMDGLSPRSPVRDYPGASSRGFGGLPGNLGSSHSSLDDIDRREFRRFGDPMGISFHDRRFPAYPSHLHRGEFDGPGRNGDFVGHDFLPSHYQRGEHLGPHNLRLGETDGFGGFPGHARMGDMAGPENFPRPRLGEPGFRSSFSRYGFPNDGGIYAGDMESLDNSRKRKPPSMGWCRICKVDCKSVDGLDMHSQTREHQKMSMDMVVRIKQNAKKQKLTSSEHTSFDDANKLRNANFEGRGKKH